MDEIITHRIVYNHPTGNLKKITSNRYQIIRQRFDKNLAPFTIRTMATFNHNKLVFIILLTKSVLFAEALKCFQCGQYNDGVGSITPCLNYTEQTAPFYLKDCPRSSDAYCIVSYLKI